MNFLLASSPVTSQLHQVRRHSLAWGLSAECSLCHAIDEATLLKFGQGPLSRSSCDVASLGSSANRKAEAPVVRAVVAPSNFEEDGAGLATQREIGGQSSIQR